MLPLKAAFDNIYREFFFDSIVEYINRPATKYDLVDIDAAVVRFFSPEVNNLKELLLASPENIENIKVKYESFSDQRKSLVKGVLNLQYLYAAFSGGSFNVHTSGKKLTSEFHYKKLEFENCPYCNESKIASWEKIDGTIKRTYDWDHFVPQTAFPFLAISLYNLIPSCKVCNFLKLDSVNIGLNPHYDYSIDELFTFSIKAHNLNYFESTDDFEIKKIIPPSKYGNKLKQQLDTIYLEQRYSESKQMLSFAMRKYKSHSRSTFRSLENLVGLISTKKKQALFERLFSVYTDERYYKHMPYSKLLSDILYRKNAH